MHWIVTENDEKAAGCTAYAIAPHALLTAEHCDLKDVDEDGNPLDDSPHKLFIDRDGKPNYAEWTPYQIVGKEFDGSDHMILLVSGPAFRNVINYDPATYQPPVQGEHVMTWGNPEGIRDEYREGYVMGVLHSTPVPFQKEAQDCWLVDERAMPGDSGSAIFDATDGHIVAIVTYGIADGMFTGAFALHFTPGQVSVAKAFKG